LASTCDGIHVDCPSERDGGICVADAGPDASARDAGVDAPNVADTAPVRDASPVIDSAQRDLPEARDAERLVVDVASRDVAARDTSVNDTARASADAPSTSGSGKSGCGCHLGNAASTDWRTSLLSLLALVIVGYRRKRRL
jgi:hypothetical protein